MLAGFFQDGVTLQRTVGAFCNLFAVRRGNRRDDLLDHLCGVLIVALACYSCILYLPRDVDNPASQDRGLARPEDC